MNAVTSDSSLARETKDKPAGRDARQNASTWLLSGSSKRKLSLSPPLGNKPQGWEPNVSSELAHVPETVLG